MAVILFLCLTLLSFGCSGNSSKPSTTATSVDGSIDDASLTLAVRVSPVERRTLRRVLRTTADLKPEREVKVISLVSERIVSFNIENGDFIEKGEIIAVIRSDALKQALIQLDAEIAAVNAELTAKRLDLNRGRQLYKKQSISRQAFEQLQSAYDTLVARQESLIASRAQQLINQQNSTIRAPISGVVANKTLQVGDLASPQSVLCSLYAIDILKVTLQVGESDVPRVTQGQSVQLVINAWPGRTFKGDVARIFPYLDPSNRSATVEIELQNPALPETGRRELSPGMFGSAQLVLEEAQDVPSIPARALLFGRSDAGTDAETLFIIDDQGRARVRHPTIGLREDEFVEIMGGVELGEEVVVVGQQNLSEGDVVEVLRQNEEVDATVPDAARADSSSDASEMEPASADAGAYP